MIVNVHLREEVDSDLAEAASWHEQQQVGLGHKFLDEVLARHYDSSRSNRSFIL